MRSVPVLALVASLVPVVPAGSQAADVQRTYDQLEKDLDAEYAKLTQDAKNGRRALENQVAGLEKQIAALKQAARKIELLSRKIDALLPKVMGPLGSHAGGGPTRPPARGAGDPFAALLGAEIARAGLNVSPADLQDLVSAIQKGGAAGVAVAMYLCLAIAEIDADSALGLRRPALGVPSPAAAAAPAALQSLLGTLDFPRLTPGEIGGGASLSGSAASAYFSALVEARAGERASANGTSIATSTAALEAAREKIKETDKLLLDLQKKHDAAASELRRRRAAALARVPTPTPTPGRMPKSP